MRVAVKLHADAAASMEGATSVSNEPAAGARAEPAPAKDLLAVLSEQGAELETMHPSTLDPQLQTWFMVGVADETSARRLVAILEGVDGVEAAYVQPPDFLP